jgi:hypothetical protein
MERPTTTTEGRTRGQGQAKGTIAELDVSADLINRGFDVYRNVSPVGPVDMIALSGAGETLLVQVTSGYHNPRTGCRQYNNHEEQPLWNVIAVRYEDGIAYYSRSGEKLLLPPQMTPDIESQESTVEREKIRIGAEVKRRVEMEMVLSGVWCEHNRPRDKCCLCSSPPHWHAPEPNFEELLSRPSRHPKGSPGSTAPSTV